MNEIVAPEDKIRNTAERMLRRLAGIRCTLVQSGDPVRFEGAVHRIVEPGRLPTAFESCIGLKFKAPVDSRFGLWEDKTIFFDPQQRKWIGYGISPDEVLLLVENAPQFMVEIPGLIYNYRDYFDPASWPKGSTWHDNPIGRTFCDRHDPSRVMDTLGLAISGTNIRRIFFKKICNDEWSGSGYDRLTIQTVKGLLLIALIKNLKESKTVPFTEAELNVLDRYLEQCKLLGVQ